MSDLSLASVNKFYGAYHALHDVDLDIRSGTFVALIGPSGCGKSTLLRTIAGLESISSGTIRIAGEAVNDLPPRKRDVAMVFQSYALYPHMDVDRNMTYSLRLRRRPKEQIAAAVEEAASTLGLSHLLKRYPRELSGGQRQRVAMGRAIVRHPKLFLFDEPLSNLDAELRVRMRAEVRALHERLGATSVYVTHDQVEAMTMADHVVVLRAGVIEQQGAPLDLYDRPANRFVASFIGSPSMNFLPGRTSADGRGVTIAATGITLPLARAVTPGREVLAGLRPEHIVEGASGPIEAVVTAVEATGSQAYVHTDLSGQPLSFVLSGRTTLGRGDAVSLSIAPESIHLFDAATDRAL
jgi:multiple sugar transport system ATP-binding protein